MKIKFKEWDCIVEEARYNNDRIALELVDARDGEPICMATVNIPEVELAPDEVLIKNWSENVGVYQALRDAGVISEFTEAIPTGFVEALKCKLLIFI